VEPEPPPPLQPTADCKHPMVRKSCTDGYCAVPAGCFIMGAPRGDVFAAAVSDREVQVTLTHALIVGETEVTVAQWEALGLPGPVPDWRATGSKDADTPPAGYSACKGSQCPATFVTVEDAASYVNLLSERDGLRPCYLLADCIRSPGQQMRCQSIRVDAPSPYECEGYRLPTEAEWEYVARAGARTTFYSGDANPDREVSYNCGHDASLDAIGWYCGNSGNPPGETGGRARHVAQKKPNAWGLYDVSGNAYEWTNDLYNPLGYGDGPLIDPIGGLTHADDLTPKEHPVHDNYHDIEGFPGYRVLRGGSFDIWASTAASARRANNSSGGQASGFRVVRSVDVPRADQTP
jgi:formylglycine-generating enzyme